MSATVEPPRPEVDDQYWFDLSKEMVQGAASNRNEAAAKLQTMVVWLWGIYTASAAIGLALSKTSYPLIITILIASPSVFLIAAYWLAAWVQMPVGVQFDPRIPEDIKGAYTKGLKSKRQRLAVALAVSLFAAILVSASLIGASLSKQAAAADFQAYHHTQEGPDTIAVSGHLPPDTKIVLRITTSSTPDSPGMSKELLYVTSPTGELQTSIALDFAADKYDVTLEWKEEDGLARSLKRAVLP
jgi:hypothetical protein